MISFVLSIALLFAIASSLLAGTIIPFIFARLKLDPADASGPIGTIIQDTISVSIYLIVASWLLL
jgi:magnesium transporter